jgi:hypothetical protein
MSLVDDGKVEFFDPAKFSAHRPWQLGTDGEPELWPQVPVQGVRREPVQYRAAVRSDHAGESHENFATIKLTKARGVVNATVIGWRIRSDGNLPEYDYKQTVDLS